MRRASQRKDVECRRSDIVATCGMQEPGSRYGCNMDAEWLLAERPSASPSQSQCCAPLGHTKRQDDAALRVCR